MRTDVTINTTKEIRIPSIIAGECRPCFVSRGDFIMFQSQSRTTEMGRIVGSLVNPDDGLTYLCVMVINIGGAIWERWVLPSDVTDTRLGKEYMSNYGDKAKWFFGPDFFKSDVDKARQAFDLLAEELV